MKVFFQIMLEPGDLLKHHGKHFFECFAIGFAVVCNLAILQNICIIGKWQQCLQIMFDDYERGAGAFLQIFDFMKHIVNQFWR